MNILEIWRDGWTIKICHRGQNVTHRRTSHPSAAAFLVCDGDGKNGSIWWHLVSDATEKIKIKIPHHKKVGWIDRFDTVSMATAAGLAAWYWVTAVHVRYVTNYHLRSCIFCLRPTFHSRRKLICDCVLLFCHQPSEKKKSQRISCWGELVVLSIASPPSIHTHWDSLSSGLSPLTLTISPPPMAPYWLHTLRRADNKNISFSVVTINSRLENLFNNPKKLFFKTINLPSY